MIELNQIIPITSSKHEITRFAQFLLLDIIPGEWIEKILFLLLTRFSLLTHKLVSSYSLLEGSEKQNEVFSVGMCAGYRVK